MIVGVSTMLNEADVCKRTVYHLFDQGVDRVYIALGKSTDGTEEILREAAQHCDLLVVPDDMEYHAQPHWMNRLTHLAGQEGASWVLPFDADEWWYTPLSGTIKYVLDSLNEDMRVLHVSSFQHRDFDYRWHHMGLGKVAFRYDPNIVISNGNHSVNAGPAHPGLLALREIQFRSVEHLIRKCHERVDRLDPSLPVTDGAHQRELAVLSDDELRARWVEWQERDVVFDPIPSTRRI